MNNMIDGICYLIALCIYILYIYIYVLLYNMYYIEYSIHGRKRDNNCIRQKILYFVRITIYYKYNI